MAYTTPDTDTLQGRQLDGLLRSTNNKARMLLTVDIRKQGGGTYHQTYRAKAWTSRRDGHRMLTLDLGDGDYMAGIFPTKVVHVDTTEGTVRPARGMQDQALLYGAQAALRWAFTGQAPTPGNGTVEVTAAQLCGSCGAELTHPVSKELGIGPECAKRLGLEHHYSGKTLTSRARKAAMAAAPEVAALAAKPVAELTLEEAEAVYARTTKGTPQAAELGQHIADLRAAATAPAQRPVAEATRERAEEQEAAAAAANPLEAEAIAASNVGAVLLPCRLCNGQSRLSQYTCGYCASTGLAAYDTSKLPAAAADLLAQIAREARDLAGRMAHTQGETSYVQLADQLDSVYGAFFKVLAEAQGTAVAAAAVA